jgi:hypothetical protein
VTIAIRDTNNLMATTVNAAFETMISNLTPSATETASAASHRQSVTSKLSDDLGVSNFFSTGSTGNGTGVRYYSDVDYFASIPSQNQRSDSNYMLQIVKGVLDSRFPATDIHISTPAVVCNFGTDGAEKIEVVPAYYVSQEGGANVYKIPLVGGGWIKSSPRTHNAYVSSVHSSLNYKVKPLIRLIKAIKYYNNIPISSFYIELRVAKWASTEKTIDYKYDVRTMLKHLVDCGLAQMVDPMGISGYVAASNTDPQKLDALSKLGMALTRAVKAREAEEAGKIADAFYWWDKVFNDKFPAYG